MAITAFAARLLVNWVAEYGIAGRALQMGRQDVRLTVEDFRSILRNAAAKATGDVANLNAMLDRLGAATRQGSGASVGGISNGTAYISDKLFFDVLGFTSSVSVDASSFEGADIIYDLNESGLYSAIQHPVNFILETGTAEHIFHIPNYLFNVTSCLDLGGYAVHFVPVNNYVDHGFYQFSPTLLFDYYTANKFKIIEFLIFETAKLDWRKVKVRNYVPGEFDALDRKRFSRRFAVMGVMVKKEERSTCGKIPQQRIYGANVDWRIRIGSVDLEKSPVLLALEPPFTRETGHCYRVGLPPDIPAGDSLRDPTNSPLVLLEQGVPLPHAHAPHVQIRETGRGRYSHWNEALLFSTSDNSDPNINGRRYELKRVDG